MPKRTYQPKKTSRKRKCGYRSRTATKNGRKVIKNRKLQGRWKLTPV